MTSYCLILFALYFRHRSLWPLFPERFWTLEGKPMVGALVMYTQIGIFDRNYKTGGAARSESPRMVEGTGRIYKIKTDKKALSLWWTWITESTRLRLPPQTAAMFIPKETIVGNDEPSAQNILNVDLSTVEVRRSRVAAPTWLRARKQKSTGIDPAGKRACGKDQQADGAVSHSGGNWRTG